jgi:hypothetical protein
MPRLAFVTAVLLAVLVVIHLSRAIDPVDSFAVAEQARVRAHFDSAEREVRSHPVTGLSSAQRAARARALDRLHAYAVRGVFPKNRQFPGVFVPSFVDDRTGTRCGMAYLIEQSGSSGFVARIAATNNNATIPELKDDPELLSWLEDNGLTLAEAARIQPSYCGLPPEQQLIPCNAGELSVPVNRASAGYKTATAVSVGADVLAVALGAAPTNLSRTLVGSLAVATGMAGLAIGAPNVNESGSRRTIGFVNAGVGAVSAAFGVYRLIAKRSTVTPVSFEPWFSPSGAPGLLGRVSF